MKDNVFIEKLEFLYPKRGEEINKKLQHILTAFSKEFKAPKKSIPLYSEKDAVLICYADHVYEENKKTFQTMHTFLNKYVKGSIPKVHFLPFYPYSSDDGFSVINYYKVKDEFGSWDDVRAIATDFDLMYDFVCNHISQKSVWFKKFLEGDSKFVNFFIAFDEEVDVSKVFRPRAHPLLTAFETKIGKKYVWTTFSADQIDVNFENPEVLLEMIKVFLFYIKNGAKLIRMDAVHMMWKQLGTYSVDLPQTHEIIKIFREVVNQVSPNVWLITEQNRPHLENISYFGNGNDEAQLVYNFALPPLLLHTFINGDASVLTNWAKTLKNPSDEATFFNFSASHDGIPVLSLYNFISEKEMQSLVAYCASRGGKILYRKAEDGSEKPYEFNIVFFEAMGKNIDKFMASQAAMVALQGVPGIYFNSFFGSPNWTEGVEKLGYTRAINREKFLFQTLSDEINDTSSIRHTVYNRYKKLLSVRANEPLFNPTTDQEILDLDTKLFTIKRYKGSQSLISIINVSDEEILLPKEKIEIFGHKNKVDILTGTKHSPEQDMHIMPYQVLWLK